MYGFKLGVIKFPNSTLTPGSEGKQTFLTLLVCLQLA